MKSETPHAPLRRTLRESAVVVGIWAFFAVWVLGVAKFHGYQQSDQGVKIQLGMPAWVLWGVVIPWFFATVSTVVFASFGMKDEEA